MAEVKSRNEGVKLVPIYIVALVSVVLAAVCGAITIGMAIAFLAGHAVSFLGFMGMVLNASDGLVMPIAIGLFGVTAALVSMMAFKKIKKSPESGVLVKSDAYQLTNTVGTMMTSFVGAVFVIYALATTLSTLLAMQKGLPFADYYLGQFLPALLLGLVLIGVALLISGFAKAKVSMMIVWLIPLIVAAFGFVFVAVSVGVKSHSDDASIFGITRSASSYDDKDDYDYSDYDYSDLFNY